MKATSTTSSPDLATDNSGSRRKKNRVYLSREQKEKEEKRRFPRLPINKDFLNLHVWANFYGLTDLSTKYYYYYYYYLENPS